MQTTGHLLGEEYFFDTVTYMGNTYSIQKYFHIPGIDWVVPLKEPLYPWCPKMAASVAHLLNRKRVFSETFAGCGWGMDLGFMRYMVNKQYVFGVNLLTSISAKLSLRGMERAKFWPGGLMVQQPYWEHVKVFADYVSRLSYLNSTGKHISEVAVLFPITEVWAKALNKAVLDEYEKVFVKLTNGLFENQIDFDILDDDAICDANVKDSRLLAGPGAFKVLVVPPMKTIKVKTLEKLLEFKNKGGKVIFTGCLPDSSVEKGGSDEGIKMLVEDYKPVAAVHLAKAVLKQITPDLIATPKDGVYYQHRVSEKTHYYMIVNSFNKERSLSLVFNRKDHPKVLDPETGLDRIPERVFSSKGKAGIDIALGPYDVVYVFFEGKRLRPGKNRQKIRKVINIAGKWDFESRPVLLNPHLVWNFENIDKGDGFPKKIGLGQWKKYGSPHFSGKGIYEKDIVIERKHTGRKLELDLGDVGLTAKLLVNGREVGIKVWKPFRFDLSGHLKAGNNKIRIEVCSSLIEHYSQYKELHGLHAGYGGIIKSQLKSGLIGPVRLKIY